MMNWEDMRYFLAVARKGSVSGAAKVLGVNHSTVSRRITAFEKQLGVRLFERLPGAFVTTAAGEDILTAAEHMEDEVAGAERRILGQDTRLGGVIRVTAPDSVINKLLMPDFAAFLSAYPDIELQIVASDNPMNLNKREADVAIRVTDHPPENLIGRRLLKLAHAVYGSTEYLACHPEVTAKDPDVLTWLTQDDGANKPKWLADNFSQARARSRMDSPLVLVEAAKAGIGMAQLACFIGDTEPNLRRVPGAVAETGWDLWILTHSDLRATVRVRTFINFMVAAINRHRDLLEGRLARN